MEELGESASPERECVTRKSPPNAPLPPPPFFRAEEFSGDANPLQPTEQILRNSTRLDFYLLGRSKLL